MITPLLIGITVGALLGGLAVALRAARTREALRRELATAEASRELADRRLADRDALEAQFRTLSGEALRSGGADLVALARRELEPLLRLIDEQRRAVGGIDERAVALGASLRAEIGRLVGMQEALRGETHALATALRRPTVRGAWGEVQLRNVVELAGMAAQCDFVEQPTLAGEDGAGAQRPDLVVRLPGGGSIAIDAKVPLDAWLDAVAATDEEERRRHVDRHAAALEQHGRALAAKAYWKRLDPAPEFVVLFVRVESSLVAALDLRPELQERLMQAQVLLATPTTLLALLRATAWGWREEALARNAESIARTGADLCERLGLFVRHLEGVGAALRSAGGAYDKAVGSFDRRVLPAARKLHEFTGRSDEPAAPAPLHLAPRQVAEPRGSAG